MSTVILCKGEVIRLMPQFKLESDTLRTTKSEPEFEPDTFWHVANVLTTRKTGEYPHALNQHIESA